jgi:hypothetical protein
MIDLRAAVRREIGNGKACFQGVGKTGATGLEPATSGVTDRKELSGDGRG